MVNEPSILPIEFKILGIDSILDFDIVLKSMIVFKTQNIIKKKFIYI